MPKAMKNTRMIPIDASHFHWDDFVVGNSDMMLEKPTEKAT
jgi:hypothetical protein